MRLRPETSLPATLTRAPSGHLAQLVRQVLDRWPEHEGFLAQRFAGETADQLRAAESVARTVWRVVSDDVESFVAGYRWMCQAFLAEEEYFRRHGRYRHASYAEVERSGCTGEAYMTRYMKGLLLSQVLWLNHARVLEVYTRDFLTRRGWRSRLLEVGPGHGLLLALAAEHQVLSLSGWDISGSSLRLTEHNLRRLGVPAVDLAERDIRTRGPAGEFDLIVASELLEHVERPDQVLRALARLLATGGRLFLNVPVNSPAPDHIYLWRTPEEFFEFVADCGITPVRSHTFPLTGYTERRARARGYTISCALVGRRHDDD